MSFDPIEARLTERLDEAELQLALMRARELPGYATEWERRAVATPFGALEIEAAIALLRTLHDPETCPEEWLFLLAWDLSVDVWEATWPVRIKRAVCLAAWTVHRHKGTRYAIETALSALDVRSELTPWFEQDPEGARGTFEAVLYNANPDQPGQILSESEVEIVRRAIHGSKPLTRHFDLVVGHDITTTLPARASVGMVAVDWEEMTVERPAGGAA